MSPRLKKIIRISIISVNIVALIIYLLSCLVPFISASDSWFIAMLGLIFPLLFFVISAFLVYWLIRKSKWVFVCMAALLLSLQQISVVFSFHPNKEFNFSGEPGTLRILTWNLSSWGESNKKNHSKTSYQDEMISLIKKSNADILCLQEYLYLKEKKYTDSIIPALKETGYLYAYFAKPNYTKRVYKTTTLTAIVILSKYPILDTARFVYDKDDFTEPLIYADIKIHDRIVRVFTTHLQSVRFEYHDYDALHNLKEPSKASVSDSRAIAYKLRLAYKKRAIQAQILNKRVKESPYPVIVCGDLNDVPNSFTYFTVKEGLQDAFLKKGTGFGRTFRFISPTLRIDYIFADKNFIITQFGKIKAPYSDHYPIMTDFNFSKKNK